MRKYEKPDLLHDTESLSGKVFMVTGANAGIGREIASYLAQKKATVYMVCRSPERAIKAVEAIKEQSKNDQVHLLLADCGLEADVRRVWQEFVSHQENALSSKPEGDRVVRLDALICNAGALLNHKTLSKEGVEVTFATHLLFGTYLLGSLAMPLLLTTPEARLIVVSSGGMYNTKFPSWDVATSTGVAEYDGQFAYAFAKRGQVLLCEQWAAKYPSIPIVSCHPGWTMTEGVEAAYGEAKKYLEPLRTLWQGAEGIIWLAIAPSNQIESGAFYLDRSPQVKHMAGPFFTEGTFTKNSADEVADMMDKLEKWSNGNRPSQVEIEEELVKKLPLKPSQRMLNLETYMGKWYVLANIPTYFELGTSNCVENYSWDDNDKVVRVNFQYHASATAKKRSEMKMRGAVTNYPFSTHWAMDPKFSFFHLPLQMDYLVVDFDEANTYCIVSVPDRSALWIMVRQEPSEYLQANVPIDEVYELANKEGALSNEKMQTEKSLLSVCAEKLVKLGFDTSKILRSPWSLALAADGDA